MTNFDEPTDPSPFRCPRETGPAPARTDGVACEQSELYGQDAPRQAMHSGRVSSSSSSLGSKLEIEVSAVRVSLSPSPGRGWSGFQNNDPECCFRSPRVGVCAADSAYARVYCGRGEFVGLLGELSLELRVDAKVGGLADRRCRSRPARRSASRAPDRDATVWSTCRAVTVRVVRAAGRRHRRFRRSRPERVAGG